MKYILIGLAVASMSVVPFACRAEEAQENPPEECSQPNPDCGCSADSSTGKSARNGCVFLTLGLGRTTPWTDARPLALKVFEMKASPMLFTPESLYVTLDYAYKGVGNADLPDGTPREVDFGLPEGEPLRFSFAPGESVGAPAPGISARRPERLMMVDAEGWAVTNAPVYWDLNVGNGDVWRFLASDATGERGKLVSFRDARGRVFTGADFGLDVVRDANGVRQVVTPARLADVTALSDGYDVRVWPLAAPPEVDPATGLYAVPDAAPVRTLSVRREREGRRLVATFDEGAVPERYVFDYAGGEWTLAAPSGVRSVKEREQTDEDRARIRRRDYAADGTLLAQTVDAYAWTSWGFARTNRVEGFGGVTRTTTWTYVLSGTGRGNVRARTEQTGRVTSYAYDAAGRVASETETGPGAPTNRVEYAYAPLVSDDHAAAVDTRPRTVVRRVDGIECGRTYYVYTALTDVVERAAAQGAPYGATNALRTVTAYHPADAPDGAAGRVRSVRREDGRLDAYAYALADGIWTTTVTHLHERAPAPAEGRTTRDVTRVNARNETVERRTEAFVGGAWRVVARTSYIHDAEGRVVRETDLAGRVAETGWDCCRKISESRPDGSRTTYAYDADGRLVAESRLTALDLTNDTWVTTCHRHDGLGRVVATWTTNYEHGVGLPATTTAYDALGRVAATTDALGNARRTAYSPDGLTQTVTNPNGATRIVARNADGTVASVAGTAVLPEFTTRGILPDGTKWTRTVRGASPESPRFAVRYENMLGQTVREEKPGFGATVLITSYAYDEYGHRISETFSCRRKDETVLELLSATLNRYDFDGTLIVSARDVNLNGVIDFTGPDRVSGNVVSYVLVDDDVWRETVQVSYPDSGNERAVVTARTREKLTGFGHFVSVSEAENVHGVVSVMTETIDRNTGLIVFATKVPTSSQPQLHSHRCGKVVESISTTSVTNHHVYDVLGRLVINRDGRGNATRTVYDGFGRIAYVENAASNRTSYAYDVYGRKVTTTDAMGNTVHTAYDLRGNVVRRWGATSTVWYEYDDASGRLVAMATTRDTSLNPEQNASLDHPLLDVTRWLYDEATGLLTNKVYANGNGPVYAYTPDGKLARRTWARGVVTAYGYNGTDELLSIDYSDGTPGMTFSHDRVGNLISAIVPGVSTNIYSYSVAGILTNEWQNGISLDRFHDVLGREVGYKAKGSDDGIRYAYDDLGRLTSVISGTNVFSYSHANGSDLVSGYDCGAFSRRVSYEPCRDFITAVSNKYGGRLVSAFDYANDAAGRRVARVDTFNGMTVPNSFDYNSRSEVVAAHMGMEGFAYSYDSVGNRVSSERGAAVTTYGANSLNQYTVISNTVAMKAAYDADGNMVDAGNGWHYVWNAENRMILASNAEHVVTYAYDHRGRMVFKSVDAAPTRYLWDEYNIVAEMSKSGTVHNVWGLGLDGTLRRTGGVGGLLAVRRDKTLFLPAYDANGNVTEYISALDGVVSAHYVYSAFGEEISASEEMAGKFSHRFSTRPWCPVSQMSEYPFRKYHPILGRWMSRDPIGENDSPLLYCYIINNPVYWIDPLGEEMTEASCASAVGNALNQNEKGRNLVGALQANGCSIPSVSCECCNFSGYFSPSSGNMTICYNNTPDAGYIIETVVHELIHAYDNCTGTNWNDCESRACSEIRAANYDGGCRRGGGFRKPNESYRDCVRRSAIGSVESTRTCGSGETAVDAVFNRCFQNPTP